MKRKYANYQNWKDVEEKRYVNKYFNNDDFKGNISLLTAMKVKKKLVVDMNGKEVVVLDDNFRWLEVYPDNNKNIAASIIINDKNEILQWYFDIAKDTSFTENGVPYIDDLYLDVIMYPSGKLKMVDQDELQEALDIHDITKEDFDLAYKVAESLMKDIDGKAEELTEFTFKYLKCFEQKQDIEKFLVIINSKKIRNSSRISYFFMSIGPISVTVPAPNVKTKSFS